MENLKLVFINRIGTDSDGNQEFDLYYSTTPEDVWAEDFAEQVPSICGMDDMIPDIDTYDAIRRVSVNSKQTIFLAVENSCFSMQDCMDGIIQLVWIKASDGNYYGLDYGVDAEHADDFLKSYGFKFDDLKVVNADRKTENADDLDDEDDFGDFD